LAGGYSHDGGMPERHFIAQELVRRERPAVFARVADYHTVRRVLKGISHWQPLSAQVQGVGAQFRVEMHAWGLDWAHLLVLETWDEPRTIGWRSAWGLISQRGNWSFESRPEGTLVTLAIAYTPPAGRAGNLLAACLDSVIRRGLKETLRSLREQIEED
jgi:hypothetical protein